MTRRQRRALHACLLATLVLCAMLLILAFASSKGHDPSIAVNPARTTLFAALEADAFALLTGLLALAFGALLLAASLVGACMRIRGVRDVPYLAGMLLAAGGWIIFRLDCAALLIPHPAALRLLDTTLLPLIALFLALYLRGFVTGKPQRAIYVDLMVSMAALCASAITLYVRPQDLNRLQSGLAALMIAHAGCCLLCLFLADRSGDARIARSMLLSTLPMCVGGALEAALYLLGTPVRFTGFQAGLLFFIVIQMGLMLQWLEHSAAHAAELEHELYQNRVAMMLSQIQPHFLYNVLTAIKQLCATDPEKAEEAIGDFSGYLRTNLDSLSKTDLIPLSRELVHAEQYVKLERMRFGNRVKLVYDLRYTAFSLPTLTVQPIVENAVRYGVTKKPQGGTVTVFSDETEQAYIVRVSDDGVGFDPNAALAGGRSHIGLANVKSRLAALCDGTLTVASTPGLGTVVTIEIPKKEADAE